MLDWWTRNFKYVALPVLVGSVLLSWLGPSLNYEFFCKGDNSCFREWVGALSGWAAFGAALITVKWLKQQIADANRHQNENIELAIMSRMAIAQSFYIEASHLIKICSGPYVIGDLTNEGKQTHTVRDHQYKEAKAQLAKIKQILSGGYVTAFEREIGLLIPSFVPLDAINEVVAAAESIDRDFHGDTPIAIHRAFMFWTRYKAAIRDTLEYAQAGEARARLFSDRWAGILST